ncbi:MAG TPA: aldo/keto reductase [Tepidisphaeraceae bacterium]|jgi:predicted dehydrogenase/aryl-alcohol dehydrogenase-like predicted oxidoreductase|nr:aldo/keto reductase [Tepidisphaeraceae bacterium]
MSTTNKVNWGILTTGAIASCFARNLAASQTGRLLAVSSRDKAKADKFAAEFKAERSYGSYEELLADTDVQAVYISTPHPLHTEWAIKAMEAKKHVLVEKPVALNTAQAMAMLESATVNDVLLMEAFMYRCHPQTAKLVELIKNKEIGDVRMIRASFGWHGGFNAESRIYSNELAGGGIMDVGCYTTSMARLIAGATAGKDFADPVQVTGAAHLGETGVDEWAIASMKFPGDVLAQLSTSVSMDQEAAVTIYGSAGKISLPNPWVANREKAQAGKIIMQKKGQPAQEIDVPADVTSFTLEADVFGRALLAGEKQAPAPAMTWADTMGNIRAIDRWRDAVGLTYKMEKPEGYPKTTIANRPLARGKGNMKYGRIAGIDKEVSRLVMGCDNQQNLSHAAIMFDDWFARGGNTFDTSFIYGGGKQEQLLGQWMELRGVRDQCVTIVKGLHTPDCYPARLEHELPKSLERLRTPYTDLYVMHRDNPKVPVGEFVSVINDHIKAGRVKAWGGSNWTPARFEEAVSYAKQHGLQAPVAVSNNFSLARMIKPIWAGCIASSELETQKWHAAHKADVVLLPWSSQARGFFLPGVASPEQRDNKEVVETWYSDDNFERQRRAFALAEKRGVTPINIALAYVLCQPFPTFPLIGPRQLSETRTSLPALDIQLSQGELKWLDLQADQPA